MTTPFSQRYGVAPAKQPAAREEVPLRVRGEFLHVLEHVSRGNTAWDPFTTEFYERIRPYIWEVLKNAPPYPPHFGAWNFTAIEETVNRCEWYVFYDICELACNVVAKNSGWRVEEFQTKLNEIFAIDVLPWCLDGGLIAPRRPAVITEIFEHAKTALSEPRFSGPDEQFSKANQHLAKRPEPDTENCVKDAIGALEGIARIATNQPKRTLGEILKREPLKSTVPPLLLAAIEKVYAYRGDEPGVAHGQIGPSTVAIEEADWVLSMCASTMVYFAKRFPS